MTINKIPIGEKFPGIINVVVEIPKGTHNKYEYVEDLNTIKLDRVLHSPVFYPTDYGFIPETRGEDGDHLDVLVIISEPVFPGCLLEARPIGILSMSDDKGEDSKIIAVCANDPRLNAVNDIEDMEEHFKKEIQHFFSMYKELEDKNVEVKGFLGKSEAEILIKNSHEKYLRET